VPDWSNTEAIAKPFYKDTMGQPSNFKASGNSVASPKFLQNYTCLVLSDHIIDHIAEISDVRTELTEPENEFLNRFAENNSDKDSDLTISEIFRFLYKFLD